MTGLKAFRPGNWNGEPVSAADVQALGQNYARFIQGDPPFYIPFVSINHDDSLSFGRVTRCEVDAAGEMSLDLANVPQVVRDWMQTDRLTSPSIEFWPPYKFIGPDGSPWPSRVLKCVTLLGNVPPGVKGLPPLAAAKYRDADTGARKFSDLPPATKPGANGMDRTSMIQTLGDMGFPADTITAGTDDATVKAFLDFLHKQMADVKKNADEDEDGDTKDVKKNADDEEVKKYRDKLSKAATEADALLATLRTQAAATVADRTRQANELRATAVKKFRDEMVGLNPQKVAYMTPNQFDAVEPMLLQLDGQTVRKFADGKADGTALDEQFARLRASFSQPVKKFGDQSADGKGGDGDGRGHLTAERRAEMLGYTEAGKAILAREKAAAK